MLGYPGDLVNTNSQGTPMRQESLTLLVFLLLILLCLLSKWSSPPSHRSLDPPYLGHSPDSPRSRIPRRMVACL
jgi:hypothetical protein